MFGVLMARYCAWEPGFYENLGFGARHPGNAIT
jgi:hypothetical protein